MLLPYLTLANTVQQVESFLQVEFMYNYPEQYRMVPGMKLPVITNEADHKVIPMTWGLKHFPGKGGKLPWVRSEGIIKKAGSRILIRTHRCIVLTNCFYIQKEHSVYLFYVPKMKILTLAGIWKVSDIQDHASEVSFSLITRDPPPALKNFTSRIPVILYRSSVRRYLNLKSPLMDISGILNETRFPKVNGYLLGADLIRKQEWIRNDLLPAGNKIFAEEKFPEKAIVNNRYYFS